MPFRDPSPYAFAEPERLLNEVRERIPFQPWVPLLTSVRDANGECELLGVAAVSVPPQLHWTDGSNLLRETAERLPLPEPQDGRFTTLLLVVPRPGRVVFGPAEEFWLRASRYINLLRRVLGPDLALVTEHGWRLFLQQEVGIFPRLEHHDVSRDAS